VDCDRCSGDYYFCFVILILIFLWYILLTHSCNVQGNSATCMQTASVATGGGTAYIGGTIAVDFEDISSGTAVTLERRCAVGRHRDTVFVQVLWCHVQRALHKVLVDICL
jgi:hypothetical protein